MKKLIYLVRHAQSEFNEKGIFQGRLDSDLTPLGFVQARMCAEFLKDKGIQLIISSPQRRAYKTAQTISDVLDIPLKVDERIREMSFGVFEGKHFWSLVEENKETFLNWLKDPITYPLPTQENMKEFENRVKSFLEDLISLPQNRLCVVAHGGTLHAIVCLTVGLSLNNLWNIHMDNTGISLLEFDGDRFHLRLLNSLCHLKL
ncbi:histidine phosphatase family protein [Thermocrinis jamiesonii]|uniref:histidine phosphatase family protein n=1 Tax=Thermocrinis jamiesonii TaxID=1302351 RepID=UPI00049860D4|nr:histidine phosphatase family protein [Thermocrinis jamiesonii]